MGAGEATELRIRRIAARLAFVGYLAVLLGLSFAPLPGATDPYTPAHPFIYATPFVTIGKGLAAGVGSYKFAILVGNLVAFVPVGVLVPLLRPRGRQPWLTVLAVAFGLSLAIELGQLVASLLAGHPYRQADVDDLIVNTAGAAIGYALLIGTKWLVRALATGPR
jgi:glycopeptide antibiotics resistance protein